MPQFDQEKMAKFRNRLVHIFWEIDDARVYQILKDHLGDFKKLVDSIARFLRWDLETGISLK